MKILIIGGTGTISYDVTMHLAKNKKNFLTLVNRKLKKKKIYKNIKIIKLNYHNLKQKLTLLDNNYDIVINFIAYKKKHAQFDYELFKNRTKLYIFISTASVYRNNKKIINEESKADENRWIYQREKIRCEKYLLQKFKKNKFPVLIIRPGHIYSQNILPVSLWSYGIDLVINLIKTGNAYIFENNNSWSIMHSKDFAINFVNLIKNKNKCLGQIINIGSKKITNWKKIYKTYQKILSLKKINFKIIKNKKITILPNKIKKQIITDRNKFYVFNINKIKLITGTFVEKTSLKKGLEKSLKYNWQIIKKNNLNQKLINNLDKAT